MPEAGDNPNTNSLDPNPSSISIPVASPIRVPSPVHHYPTSTHSSDPDAFELPTTEAGFEQLRLEREALARSAIARRGWRMAPYAPPGSAGAARARRKYRFGLPWYGWLAALSGMGCILCLALWGLQRVSFTLY